MKFLKCFLATAAVVPLLGFSTLATFAQTHVVTPASSMPQPKDANGHMMANTHLRILAASPKQMTFGEASVGPQELPPFPGYLYETPASIACVYHLVQVIVPGCNPNVTTGNPTGGSKAIAIVDAFDNPNAATDVAEFDSQFGLPAAKLTVVYAQGTEPGLDPTGGWEVEESLDVQWAHAMAPEAKIFLVEAANNSFANLLAAVTVGSNLVAAAGGGEVSMSWGSGEFAAETTYDTYFKTPKVVYFASSGDSPGVEWPSASPYVVSAGGTSNSRNTTTGELIDQNAWQEAGGGLSAYESRPAFQNGVKYVVGAARGTPDISSDSNPATGVWVFDSNAVPGPGWYIVGGTSVASPTWAGIVNAANSFAANSQAENWTLYHSGYLTDITYGNCGVNMSDFTHYGYDLCTGKGTPRTEHGK